MNGNTKVEISVLDNGVVLSLIESSHLRRVDAFKHASRCAKEYAARYEGAEVNKIAGDFWLIQKNGKTFAQFALRS